MTAFRRLNATARTSLQPGWQRNRIFRKIAATTLILLAIGLGIRGALSTDPQVVVAIRTIEAGAAVTADDIDLRRVPAHLVPEGAYTDAEEMVGQVAVAAISTNEIPSKLRFVSPELTSHLVNLNTVETNSDTDSLENSLGPPTLVPITLADPTLAPLLRHGDTVTVVTQNDNDSEPVTVAAGGRVILSTPQRNTSGIAAGPRSDSGTILVALPEVPAKRVAAASLTSPLAVVLTGERATAGAVE